MNKEGGRTVEAPTSCENEKLQPEPTVKETGHLTITERDSFQILRPTVDRNEKP